MGLSLQWIPAKGAGADCLAPRRHSRPNRALGRGARSSCARDAATRTFKLLATLISSWLAAPADEMDEMIRSREAWSDATVLDELLALEPLPDEDTFYAANSSDEVWSRANLFHALAQICAKRKLRPAAPLLLERASDGDPGEMMRVLRHSLEAIFNPDWAALARVRGVHALGARWHTNMGGRPTGCLA